MLLRSCGSGSISPECTASWAREKTASDGQPHWPMELAKGAVACRTFRPASLSNQTGRIQRGICCSHA